MDITRRKFSREFKIAVAKLAAAQGVGSYRQYSTTIGNLYHEVCALLNKTMANGCTPHKTAATLELACRIVRMNYFSAGWLDWSAFMRRLHPPPELHMARLR